jgi:hypothetical protein
LGGIRNWDYRYCWLRDATLTLLGLMNCGFEQEAHDWHEWLLRAAAGSPEQVQIMYGIAGERRLIEWDVSWLPGYEGSMPVRVGNAAHRQRQLDVFGEVMDALHGCKRIRLGIAGRFPRLSRANLDRTRPRNLGNAQPPEAFYLFKGDGQGRVRPPNISRLQLLACRYLCPAEAVA